MRIKDRLIDHGIVISAPALFSLISFLKLILSKSRMESGLCTHLWGTVDILREGGMGDEDITCFIRLMRDYARVRIGGYGFVDIPIEDWTNMGYKERYMARAETLQNLIVELESLQ